MAGMKRRPPPGGFSSIQSRIDTSTQPLIGLQHIVEAHSLDENGHEVVRYLCNLCEGQMDMSTVMGHLVGIRHRSLYMKSVPAYKEMHDDLTNKELKRKRSELSELAFNFAMQIEVEEGRQRVRVTQDSSKPNPKLKIEDLLEPELEAHINKVSKFVRDDFARGGHRIELIIRNFVKSLNLGQKTVDVGQPKNVADAGQQNFRRPNAKHEFTEREDYGNEEFTEEEYMAEDCEMTQSESMNYQKSRQCDPIQSSRFATLFDDDYFPDSRAQATNRLGCGRGYFHDKFSRQDQNNRSPQSLFDIPYEDDDQYMPRQGSQQKGLGRGRINDSKMRKYFEEKDRYFKTMDRDFNYRDEYNDDLGGDGYYRDLYHPEDSGWNNGQNRFRDRSYGQSRGGYRGGCYQRDYDY